jgi:alpha-L-fucosidase
MRQNRREFVKFTRNAGLASLAASWPPVSAGQPAATTPAPEPSSEQRQWMDLKFGLFVHFGINTYYDKEWSDGTLDPSIYHPTKLDTDQWCRVAKAAGMRYVVLVAKHHDGFCNWRTRHTDYSLRSTPYKGDVVAELVNSAHKHGQQVGLYYSLWDRHEKTHDSSDFAYVDFMKRQLDELLGEYGPVAELWFDGFWKKQRTGWGGSGEELARAWRSEGAFRWQMDHLYQYIKELQPRCLVMNNSTTAQPGVPLHPVDIRSGEKATRVVEDVKIWHWLGRDVYLPLQIETTMSQKGREQFTSGSWFWHEWDRSAASREQILNWLQVAGTMEANLLLNVGPDPQGRLRQEDERALLTLREGVKG